MPELTQEQQAIIAEYEQAIRTHVRIVFKGRPTDQVAVAEQDGLTACCRRLPDFDPTRGATLLTFFQSVAAGEARHTFRRFVKEADREGLSLDEDRDHTHGDNPEDIFESDAIRGAIANLSPKLREVIRYQIYGLTEAETAAVLCVHQWTVHKRRLEALRVLRKRMAGNGPPKIGPVEAGRMGGNRTKALYGNLHYERLGRMGGKKLADLVRAGKENRR